MRTVTVWRGISTGRGVPVFVVVAEASGIAIVGYLLLATLWAPALIVNPPTHEAGIATQNILVLLKLRRNLPMR
jgi:hypothetical protein